MSSTAGLAAVAFAAIQLFIAVLSVPVETQPDAAASRFADSTFAMSRNR